MYSYLLFGDDSDAGEARRVAAARAYCKILPVTDPSVEEEITKKGKGSFNDFIILMQRYIPEDLQKNVDRCSKFIVKYYDYQRAEDLIDELGFRQGGMYLVAYFQPVFRLIPLYSLDPKRTLVVNLSYVDERFIEFSVKEFRRLTRRPEYWEWDFQQLAFQLRAVIIPRAGDLVKIGVAVAKELTE